MQSKDCAETKTRKYQDFTSMASDHLKSLREELTIAQSPYLPPHSDQDTLQLVSQCQRPRRRKSRLNVSSLVSIVIIPYHRASQYIPLLNAAAEAK